MPIRTHADLSLALSEALGLETQEQKEVYFNKLCFGYASTWLEAFLTGQSHVFYARMNGTLLESPQARREFFEGMARHQLPTYPQHRLQNFFKTTSFNGQIGRVFRFTGLYDSRELSDLLRILRESQLSLTEPSAWMVGAKKHSTILYFAGEQIMFCDANHPHHPIVFNGATEQGRAALVHQLMHVFGWEFPLTSENLLHDHRLLTFDWMANTQDLQRMKAAATRLQSDPQFQHHQIISPSKLRGTDPTDQTLLTRAILTHDLPLINTILSVDPAWKASTLAQYHPLSNAIMAGDLEVCKTLISHGANKDAKDENGRTALHKAILFYEPEILRFLLEQGADLFAETNKGMRPLIYAQHILSRDPWEQHRHDLIMNLLSQAEARATTRPVLRSNFGIQWVAPVEESEDRSVVVASMKKNK